MDDPLKLPGLLRPDADIGLLVVESHLREIAKFLRRSNAPSLEAAAMANRADACAQYVFDKVCPPRDAANDGGKA
jgi:hypothetical protein